MCIRDRCYLSTLAQYRSEQNTIRYLSTPHTIAQDNTRALCPSSAPTTTPYRIPLTLMPYSHSIAAYAITVPHSADQHTLSRYRTRDATFGLQEGEREDVEGVGAGCEAVLCRK
eukprot:3940311-Rhodomonas_salina.1